MRTRALLMGMLVGIMMLSVIAAPSVNAAPHSKAQWRYLIYLNADNSLDVSAGAHHEPVVQSDFDELMSVGSTKDVVVYVLVDRLDGPANLFKINKGSMTELKDFVLNGMEVNMGDPATLKEFVSYTFKAAPALKTLLMFWDHGAPEYVGSDDNPDDDLTVIEAAHALEGRHIDVIGADECLVGQVEVAYQWLSMKVDTQYLLVSETYTGWRGYPYDTTLAKMVSKPTMSPRELSIMFVEETQKLIGQNPYQGEEVTSHGAIDMSKVGALQASFTELTDLLASDMKTNAAIISKSRGGACFSFGANSMNIVDLKTFVELVAKNSQSNAVRDACARVISAFDETVIALQLTQTVDHQINGLGIVFPNHSSETPDYYWSYAFMLDGWRAFLEAYWSAAGSA